MALNYDDYAAQVEALKRRREIAQALAQQSSAPWDNQVVNGVVVAHSPWEGVAQLGKAFIARRAQQASDRDESGLRAQHANDIAAAMSQYQGAAQDPAVGPGGRALATKALTDTVAGPDESARMAIARAMAPPIRVSQGEELLNPNTLKPIVSNPKPAAPVKRNVEWKDVGDKLVPVYGDTGEDVPNLAPKRKGATPALQDKISSRAASDPDLDATAQLIADGRLAPPNAGSRSPTAIKLMSRVVQLNPGYDASDFFNRKNSVSAFGSGKLGSTVRSLDVAVSHLGTLSTLADALQNGDTPVFNSLSNVIAEQTGKPAPTNFDAVKSIVSDEIVKAVVGTGGALGDREELAKQISAAKSPDQLHGVIDNWKALMGGQLNGLERQYQAATKKDDFRSHLAKETVEQLETAAAAHGGIPVAPGAAPSALPPDIAALLQKHGGGAK